jgi:hypothetical protein
MLLPTTVYQYGLDKPVQPMDALPAHQLQRGFWCELPGFFMLFLPHCCCVVLSQDAQKAHAHATTSEEDAPIEINTGRKGAEEVEGMPASAEQKPQQDA